VLFQKIMSTFAESHVTVNPTRAEGTYDVAIAPTAKGEYEVKVGLKDTNPENLLGSPFVVKLEPSGIDSVLLSSLLSLEFTIRPIINFRTPSAEKPTPISPEDIEVDLSTLGAINEDGIAQFIIKPKKDVDIKYKPLPHHSFLPLLGFWGGERRGMVWEGEKM
jgi:hypothetical protein